MDAQKTCYILPRWTSRVRVSSPAPFREKASVQPGRFFRIDPGKARACRISPLAAPPEQ